MLTHEFKLLDGWVQQTLGRDNGLQSEAPLDHGEDFIAVLRNRVKLDAAAAVDTGDGELLCCNLGVHHP
jgi:hypothetical protein